MDEKRFFLPDRETMLERLLKVNDDVYYREGFYPLLLKHAGERKVAPGVVLLLTLAIHDFTEGMPRVMVSLLHAQMPEFIDALIIDPKLAQDAKDFYSEATNTK
ncbi:MAG: hypothetical protein AAB766_04655 [Patescibacteria group bacterium]